MASVNVVDEASIAKTAEIVKRELERNRERIAPYIGLVKSYVQEGPILDVGAGGGAFIVRTSETSLGSSGIELAPGLYENCHRAGLQISREPPESTHLDSYWGGFGAILMRGVLEHVNVPLALCRKVWELLRDSSVPLLDTPTRAGLLNRIGETTAMLSRGRYLTFL
jgi:2-polyprenyl-3-methyl-5-hydroxy-6-metoxy-1,4-benzoquinol methylase